MDRIDTPFVTNTRSCDEERHDRLSVARIPSISSTAVAGRITICRLSVAEQTRRCPHLIDWDYLPAHSSPPVNGRRDS